MNSATENKSHYRLGSNYTMSRISGKNCSVLLRDKSEEIQGVVDVCNDKISRVGGYNGEKLSDVGRLELIKFIRNNRLSMTPEAAKDLKLSVYQPASGENFYLSEKELDRVLSGNVSNASVLVNKYKKRVLHIRPETKGAALNLSRAAVKKLVIGPGCNLIIDLRDNPYIERLVIREGFVGSINAARTSLKHIDIADNCRCELSLNDSLKCFSLHIGDVFSGILNVKNSCFHHLDIGYYCYADISLEKNWGRRNIKIGNSFRGNLHIDGVHVPGLEIGDDCKGKISVSSHDDIHGARKIKIRNEFNGELDLSNSKTVSRLELGAHTRGKLNLLGCPSLQVVKIGENFNGTADFSESGIEYLRAARGCRGRLILLNCANLTLLKLPVERKTSVTIEKDPLRVQTVKGNVYYQFKDKRLPAEYFTPFYKKWFEKVKVFFVKK